MDYDSFKMRTVWELYLKVLSCLAMWGDSQERYNKIWNKCVIKFKNMFILGIF